MGTPAFLIPSPTLSLQVRQQRICGKSSWSGGREVCISSGLTGGYFLSDCTESSWPWPGTQPHIGRSLIATITVLFIFVLTIIIAAMSQGFINFYNYGFHHY